MSDDEKKKGSAIDKVVMGMIIGGAIGSVLGLSFAPKKGEETRKIIKEKGKEILQKGIEKGKEIKAMIDEKKAGGMLQPRKPGFWKWLIFGRKKQSSKKNLKQIPNESVKHH